MPVATTRFARTPPGPTAAPALPATARWAPAGRAWVRAGLSWSPPCAVPASVSTIQLQLTASFLPQMSMSACIFPLRVPSSAATCGAPTSACAPPARPCCRADSVGWREGTQRAACPGTLPCAGRGPAVAHGADPSTPSSPCAAWPRLQGWVPGARPAPRATPGGMAPARVSVHRGRVLEAVQRLLCSQKGTSCPSCCPVHHFVWSLLCWEGGMRARLAQGSNTRGD